MTSVAIVPVPNREGTTEYRAVAGQRQSVGRTAGEALDALTPMLPADESGTLLVVQHFRPDALFSAAQQQRLKELMSRWRIARDTGSTWSDTDQAELDDLISAELQAATRRSSQLSQSAAE